MMAALGGDCDPLVPEYCMLPFPNDYWRSNETGRINIGEATFPMTNGGDPISPSIGGWNDLDGFAAIPPISTYILGLEDETYAKLPFPRLWDPELSLKDESATVLLNTITGERIAHWTELDHSSDGDPLPEVRKRALLIWPAERLNSSTRYAVAVKNGGVLRSSDYFSSLLTADTMSERQAHFESHIFSPLEKYAHLKRTDLQVAWDFTVGSTKSMTERLVSARDQMLAIFEKKTPNYKIKSVQQNPNAQMAAKIVVSVEVPLFLNDLVASQVNIATPGSRLVLDQNGLPVVQKHLLPYMVDFEMLVPHSVASPNSTSPQTRVLQYGHGLFGQYTEVNSGYLQDEAQKYGYILVATNWVGLAQGDAPGVAAMLGSNLTNFAMIPDRCTQGMVNALAVMAVLHKPDFADDPAFHFPGRTTSVLDASTIAGYHYNGNSEGGIFGGVYMALSTQVDRGVLGVSGAPYSLLLPRSADFMDLFPLLKLRYNDPVDRISLLGVIQMLWDRAEPSGYLHSISREPLPGNKPHQVLFHYGLGDAQVSWLGCHIEGRSVSPGGAYMYRSNVVEGNETLFGFNFVEDDTTILDSGDLVNGIQGYTWGAPTAPFVNTPPDSATDAHEKPRRDPRAQAMMNLFFKTGQIKNFCDGPCTAKP
jgi:hypothetical protein